MLITDLNGIEFNENELDMYKEIGNISDVKIDVLNENIKRTLVKTNLKAIHDKIKILLEENEKIEDVIEGLDIDKLALITATGKYAVSASFEYALNKIVFITDRRIFVVSTNAANIQFQFKEYKKSDIKSIEIGIKRSKMSLMEKVILVPAYIFGFFTSMFMIPSGILIKILVYILYIIILYKLIRVSFNNAHTIVIKFNDGYIFEIASASKFPKNLEKRILN